jgi:ribosomal protein S18 acetylase RimI-like enzyme
VNEDVRHAFDFMTRGELAAASRVEPFRYGRAFFAPELPLRHDSNYLLVETEPEGAEQLAAEAERLHSRAGVRHRIALVPDEEIGERLAPEFERLEWNVQRGLVMLSRREPERDVDTAFVREVGEAALRHSRIRFTLDQPWGTPELAEQLLEAKRRIPFRKRFFAVVVDGEAVSWADLYLEGSTAQIEDVATLPEHRLRGYATAVVLRALRDAHASGADFVFLVTTADNRAQDIYRRLGFDEIGRYVKFLRLPPPDEP